MTIQSVLLRFGLAYVVLAIAGSLLLNLIGIQSNSGVGTAVLIASVMWACMSFAQKNQRYFSPEEKRRVMMGMIAIDVAVQAIFAWIALSQLPSKLDSGAFIFALAFVTLLHAVAIYFFVGFAHRMLKRQTPADRA